jgi:electron transfer flavoprotein alpha/beta subunit
VRAAGGGAPCKGRRRQMNIVVALKQTVDLVEELELNDDGTGIEREYLTFRLNEWDEQALEEALLLKEGAGATVTAVALDEPDVDQSLYSALAKAPSRAGSRATSARRSSVSISRASSTTSS